MKVAFIEFVYTVEIENSLLSHSISRHLLRIKTISKCSHFLFILFKLLACSLYRKHCFSSEAVLHLLSQVIGKNVIFTKRREVGCGIHSIQFSNPLSPLTFHWLYSCGSIHAFSLSASPGPIYGLLLSIKKQLLSTLQNLISIPLFSWNFKIPVVTDLLTSALRECFCVITTVLICISLWLFSQNISLIHSKLPHD